MHSLPQGDDKKDDDKKDDDKKDDDSKKKKTYVMYEKHRDVSGQLW